MQNHARIRSKWTSTQHINPLLDETFETFCINVACRFLPSIMMTESNGPWMQEPYQPIVTQSRNYFLNYHFYCAAVIFQVKSRKLEWKICAYTYLQYFNIFLPKIWNIWTDNWPYYSLKYVSGYTYIFYATDLLT